ncbi:hypothetical protein KW428_08725 [Vibrio fluvialis]|nr:hypothetical protein [Vibrio fluvialis]
MVTGEIYDPADTELKAMRASAREKLDRFNRSQSDEQALQERIITELFGAAGSNISVNRHFRCDYGVNIKVGNNFYTNYDCVILDCAEVIIGDDCLIGPQVGLCS